MAANKTNPTKASVAELLDGVRASRRRDGLVLIDLMRDISGAEPVMWGPSIIGFGSQHYKYASGHEGDMPQLAFSPRKANLTIYFEGFDNYAEPLARLGKYKLSKACLYVNKLDDIDLTVLRQMLVQSAAFSTD